MIRQDGFLQFLSLFLGSSTRGHIIPVFNYVVFLIILLEYLVIINQFRNVENKLTFYHVFRNWGRFTQRPDILYRILLKAHGLSCGYPRSSSARTR